MSVESKLRRLVEKGDAKMGTTYGQLGPVVNNLIGGYKEASWIDLGEGNIFDVKEACLQYGVDYKSLTKDDFIAIDVKNSSASYAVSDYYSNGSINCNENKTYNSENGILTWEVSGIYQYIHNHGGYTNRAISTSKVHVIILLAKKATNAGSYVDLGTGQSFDVKPYCEALGIDYQSLTVDDFDIVGVPTVGLVTSFNAPSAGVEKSYNSSTGIATIRLAYNWTRYNYQTERTEYFTYYYNVRARLLLAKKAGAGDFSKFIDTSFGITHNGTNISYDVSSYNNLTVYFYGEAPLAGGESQRCNCDVSYTTKSGQTIGLGNISFTNGTINHYTFTNIKDATAIKLTGGYVLRGTYTGSFGIVVTGSVV